RRGAVALDGELARRARSGPATPALGPVEQELVAKFEAWGLEPPRPREVAAAVGRAEAAIKPALDRLLAARVLVKIKPDYYLASAVVDALRARLIAHLDAHGEITPQQWKELTATSRKFSIPLAEHFDAEKLTLRVGDIRRRR
ncbi:MAG: SelB C-terminal domain-containing protein, partial [Myxococcales bacterium]|nr:SelB C-terminal domain-containing protein [Myxococcales bacterium]